MGKMAMRMLRMNTMTLLVLLRHAVAVNWRVTTRVLRWGAILTLELLRVPVLGNTY